MNNSEFDAGGDERAAAREGMRLCGSDIPPVRVPSRIDPATDAKLAANGKIVDFSVSAKAGNTLYENLDRDPRGGMRRRTTGEEFERAVLEAVASFGVHGVETTALILAMGQARPDKRPSRPEVEQGLRALDKAGRVFKVIAREDRWFISADEWTTRIVARLAFGMDGDGFNRLKALLDGGQL